MTALDEIRKLYDELPDVNCKGLCWNSCGPIDMSEAERQRIVDLGVDIPRFTPERGEAWANGAKLYCPALSFKARDGGVGCAVYRDRPLICRVWGVGEDDLACPHGCETTGIVDHVELTRLLARTFELGGHPDYGSDMGDMVAYYEVPEHTALLERLMKGDRSALPEIETSIRKWKEKTHGNTSGTAS